MITLSNKRKHDVLSKDSLSVQCLPKKHGSSIGQLLTVSPSSSVDQPDLKCKLSVHNIPLDSMDLVLLFCFGDDLEAMKSAFCTISYVSKAMRRSLQHFTFNTPLKFPGHLSPEYIATACRYKLRLEELSFYTLSRIDMSICMHMLNCCNLTALRSISLKTCLDPDERQQKYGNGKSTAIDIIGVPSEKLEKNNLLSDEEFQAQIALCFKNDVRCLKRMILEFKDGDLHLPLLSNVASSMTDLTLYDGGDRNLDPSERRKCNQKLAKVIRSMPNLKTLSLISLDTVPCVVSNSLENLCLECGCGVEELKCPSLKKLRVVIDMNPQGLSLLRDNLTTIEELNLTLHSKSDPRDNVYDSFLKELGDMIEKMTRLKIFVLATAVISRMNIKSETLEYIDVCDSAEVTITECKCPVLKRIKFLCEYVYDHSTDSLVGFRRVPKVYPVSPFTLHDFDPCCNPLAIADEESCVNFHIGSRPFLGMTLPDTCTVAIKMEPTSVHPSTQLGSLVPIHTSYYSSRQLL